MEAKKKWVDDWAYHVKNMYIIYDYESYMSICLFKIVFSIFAASSMHPGPESFPGVNLMSIHCVNICRTTGTALPCTNEQRITGPQAKIAWSVVLEPGPHIFLHQLITC